MKKRFLSVFLALALCMGLAVPALAADDGAAVSGTCGKNTTWSFDKATGTLTISGTGSIDWSSDSRYDFSFPWKDFKQEIRSVIIEEGVTYISEFAFENCANLTQVSIPQSVTWVGSSTFSGTPWMKNLGEFAIINGILIKYQGDAEKVAVPEGVTSVNYLAFAGNQTITEVVIPEGVTSLGSSAFDRCSNLVQITFPSTLREVGSYCFSHTRWLENQRTAGDFILAGPVLLKYQGKSGSVEIPDGVAYVEAAAFTWSSWFPFAEDLELDTVIVPTSMRDLNAELAFDRSIPKNVIYKGSREQWEMVKNTTWRENAQVPVYYADGGDLTYIFTDVPDWCSSAVDWAVGQKVTDGVGNNRFAPSNQCTNAMILTFLWRAAGESGSTAALPVDITGKNLDYAETALRWAAEKGMIDETLDPTANCTRASAVSYIWQALGKESAPASGFNDVPAGADYAAAVDWASANGIVEGYPDGSFHPDTVCNRGVIVAMLHRAYVPEARLP